MESNSLIKLFELSIMSDYPLRSFFDHIAIKNKGKSDSLKGIGTYKF